MEIETIKSHARTAVDEARSELEREGRFDPRVILVAGDSVQTLPIPGEVMESPQLRSRLFARVSAIARATGAEAVIWVVDSWVLVIDPERAKTLQPEDWEGKDTAELERLGYGKRSEAITATIETPILRGTITQHYTRQREGDRRQVITFPTPAQEMFSDRDEKFAPSGKMFETFHREGQARAS